MMRGWPGCFLLTGIVFLLQLFPVTGVFLMILGGPLWSVVLINLGFVLMARDGLTRPGERLLLLGPLLWFGGYGIAAAVSHWQAVRYNADIAAANAGKRVAFDPAVHDLVIERDRNDESNGSWLSAHSLVRDFAVDRVYEVTPGDRGQDVTRAVWVRQTACPGTMGGGIEDDRRWQRPSEGGYGTDLPRASAGQLCLFDAELRPERPAVRIRPQPQVGKFNADQIAQDIVVVAPDGRTVTLRSGARRPLSWFPQPMIGCALNSGAPAWQCFAGFRRERGYAENGAQFPHNVAAQALGLRKATLRQRYPGADWR